MKEPVKTEHVREPRGATLGETMADDMTRAAEERARGEHMRQTKPPVTKGPPREQETVTTIDGTTAAKGSGADPDVYPPSEQHLEEKKAAEEAQAKAAKGGKDKEVPLANPADTGSGVDPAGMPSEPLETAEEREKREKEEEREAEQQQRREERDARDRERREAQERERQQRAG